MTFLVALFVGLGSAWFLGKVLFNSLDDFWECLNFWVQPELVSLLFGEFWRDKISELRLWVWSSGSLGAGYLVYSALESTLG